jgi:hypothetical protein
MQLVGWLLEGTEEAYETPHLREPMTQGRFELRSATAQLYSKRISTK